MTGNGVEDEVGGEVDVGTLLLPGPNCPHNPGELSLLIGQGAGHPLVEDGPEVHPHIVP